MDRILFGDNQFFAINHLSEEKARSQFLRFRELKAITDVLDSINSLGIKTFMCTTHDRIEDICNYIRNNADQYAGFKIYPCMPYAHKYANAYTELGAIETLKKFVQGSYIETIARGSMAIANRDFLGMLKLLVDAEMKMFKGIDTPVIFLQNVVTDLLLGLQMKEMFIAFHEYIQKKYQAEAAFITMNMPYLLDVLEECGIKNPIICSSINKVGFRMAGGKENYEKILKERQFRLIAMQVLAAGAIPPKEAIEYVCGLNNLNAILFGASTKSHITETKNAIESLWNSPN